MISDEAFVKWLMSLNLNSSFTITKYPTTNYSYENENSSAGWTSPTINPAESCYHVRYSDRDILVLELTPYYKNLAAMCSL